MNGEPTDLADAKERMRVAADRLGPPAWVGRHPYGALAAALAGGLIMGGAPRGMRRVLGRGALSLLLRRM